MNKLISLAKTLSNLGLKQDSKLVYLLLKSAGPPMEGSVSMHPNETVNLYGDEEEKEDEDGNPIERTEKKMGKDEKRKDNSTFKKKDFQFSGRRRL